MKKLAIVLVLMICSLGVFAQDGTWYFSIMPGYQFGSSWSNVDIPSGEQVSIKAKTGLITSFDSAGSGLPSWGACFTCDQHPVQVHTFLSVYRLPESSP